MSSDEDVLKALLGKRSYIKGRITYYENMFSHIEEVSRIGDLQVALQKINTLFAGFEPTQIQLETINQTKYYQEGIEIENRHLALLQKIQNAIELLNERKNAVNPVNLTVPSNIENIPNAGHNTTPPLKKITIPTFSGSFNDWLHFKNTFECLVGSQDCFSDMSKLCYLKNALKGEALSLVSHLDMSSENYQISWDILVRKYDNKNLIANKHLNAIINIPKSVKNNNLTKIVTEFSQHVTSLKNLKLKDLLDTVFIFLLESKLDSNTINDFQMTLEGEEESSLDAFLEYLNKKCKVLDMHSNTSDNKSDKSSKSYGSYTTQVGAGAKKNCVLCNKPHFIARCYKFLDWDVEKRYEFVRNNKICEICLNNSHTANKCYVNIKCNMCNNKHNKLLHRDLSQIRSSDKIHKNNIPHVKNTQVDHIGEATALQSNLSTFHDSGRVIANPSTSSIRNVVLLSTAQVYLINDFGEKVLVRCLVDTASERSFITKRIAELLDLKLTEEKWDVIGISGTQSNVSGIVKSTLKSRLNDFSMKIELGVLQKITEPIPAVSFPKNNLRWPSSIALADFHFNVSKDIDLLLGSGVFSRIIESGKITLGPDKPILYQTKFGWIFSGDLDRNGKEVSSICCSTTARSNEANIQHSLAQFHKSQNVLRPPMTENEKICEQMFRNSVIRDTRGRYQVRLPIPSARLSDLGISYFHAARSFLRLENKFAHDRKLFDEYRRFIEEYLALNHARILSTADLIKTKGVTSYYMPHRAVIKENSSTTRLRVVFNASAPTNTGVSLNQIQLTGPTVQPELFTILLKFRTFKYILTTDITKMYRQTKVHPDHRPLLRILWRNDPNMEFTHIEMKRLVYGTTSASFLATRCLIQLVNDEGTQYPLASHAIVNNSYVDDVLTGASNKATLFKLYEELNQLLSLGGYELHKWYSNDPDMLNVIPEDKREKGSISIKNNVESDFRTLGLKLDIAGDFFSVVVPDMINVTLTTKREILGCLTSFFDPLGIIAPVMVNAKLIMQSIWCAKINWDDPVPLDILSKWRDLQSKLKYLKSVTIPRFTSIDCTEELQIHGFCDSSPQAYGAVVYLRRCTQSFHVESTLIASKTRVAPLKKVSLPRLELCAALLVAQLITRILQDLNLDGSKVKLFLWSDSMIALHWIKGDPARWNVYVSNRVAKINKLVDRNCWQYIRSEQNPADLLTRGVEPKKFVKCTAWFRGPSWFYESDRLWPVGTISNFDDTELEIKKSIVCSTVCEESSFESYMGKVFCKYSSYDKIKRIIAYIFQYLHILKNRISNKKLGSNNNFEQPLLFPSIDMLKKADILIIQVIQHNNYKSELKVLSNLTNLSESQIHDTMKKSKLKFLNPFVDTDKVLRVGGRLKRNPKIEFSHKHPAILPSSEHITNLIIREEHERLFHAGNQATLCSLRLRFWIVHGRQAVKRVIHECVRCFKFKAKPNNQIMADLPSVRSTPCRPFLFTGLDFAGPIQIKETRLRKPRIFKGYICLFVCMSSRSIHLELVLNLTVDAFLGALKRFIARRGKCVELYSDNGTNFRGAANELNRLYEILNNTDSNTRIYDFANKEGVKWHFIPPASPHMGGLWEGGVKSMKHHLYRVMGNNILSLEELLTLIAQIEGILNSRPIVPLSDDPNDLEALTPAHLLIGESLVSIPELDFKDMPLDKLKMWDRIKNLKQNFWKRWHKEYISELQNRYKWIWKTNNVKLGNMVLLKDDNVPSMSWKLGRIVNVTPGTDGNIRVVEIKTKDGVYKRCISKVCLLPISQE